MAPIKIDQVIYSRRRTIAIQIDRQGRVVVRAPLHANRQFIEQFVADKSSWIESKLKLISSLGQGCGHPAGPARFSPGMNFLYLGQEFPLEITAVQSRPLVHDRAFHLRQSDRSRAPAVFEAWYKSQARRVFTERVAHFANKYQLNVMRIRLSSARTRWGSCSQTGTISLTWRLVMAPLPAIDYVVVHELAHLTEKNHGPRFWAKVESMQPEYRIWRKWLKDNAACLEWE